MEDKTVSCFKPYENREGIKDVKISQSALKHIMGLKSIEEFLDYYRFKDKVPTVLDEEDAEDLFGFSRSAASLGQSFEDYLVRGKTPTFLSGTLPTAKKLDVFNYLVSVKSDEYTQVLHAFDKFFDKKFDRSKLANDFLSEYATVLQESIVNPKALPSSKKSVFDRMVKTAMEHPYFEIIQESESEMVLDKTIEVIVPTENEIKNGLFNKFERYEWNYGTTVKLKITGITDLYHEELEIISDIKHTTFLLEDFIKKAKYEYRYDLQLAWYKILKHFECNLFVTESKYYNRTAVFNLDAGSFMNALSDIVIALSKIAYYVANGTDFVISQDMYRKANINNDVSKLFSINSSNNLIIL